MNAAVRALVRLGTNAGHRVFGIQGGFKGFVAGQIRRLRWLDVRMWVTQPGANIKTRRDKDISVADLIKISQYVERHSLNVLVMVGGWDGYLSMLDLHRKSGDYPALSHLMMYCVPSTISNSAPCTSQAIGADTALNVMTEAITFIKASAASSRRVYVVEVMGRRCGYLAVAASLACGAEEMFLPECSLSLSSLIQTVADLKLGFQHFKHDMALVITTELADPEKVLTPQFISEILLRESEGVYSSVRFSKLGHVQQGSPPTPYDRILATSFMDSTLQHIVAHFAPSSARPFRGCVGTRVTGEIYTTSLDEMVHEMDFKNRRPAHQWWFERVYPYARTLAQPGPIQELRRLKEMHASPSSRPSLSLPSNL